MKRILYLTCYYYNSTQAAGLRSQRFVKALADAGHDVFVVTVGDEAENEINSSRISISSINTRQCEMAKCMKHRFDPGGRVSKYTGELQFNPPGPDADGGMNVCLIAEGASLIEKENIDLIIASGPQFGVLAAGRALSEAFNITYFAEFRDAWFTGMYWPYQNRRQEQAAAVWEQRCVEGAEKVIVVTGRMREILIERYGKEIEQKTRVIRHGYQSIEREKHKDEWFKIVYTGQVRGIDVVTASAGKRIVQQAGQWLLRGVRGARFCEKLQLEWMSPHFLLEAVGKLAKVNAEFSEKAKVIFAGQRFVEIDHWARRFGVEKNVEQLGPVPSEDAEQLAADADLLVLSLYGIKDCDYHWCVPSKIYAYLAAGNAILGLLPPGESREIIIRAGTGFPVQPDNPKAIIHELKSHFTAWQKDQSRAHPDWNYIHQFELSRQQEKFLELFS